MGRRVDAVFHLVRPLSDVCTVSIALAGKWQAVPEWFAAGLERAVINSPADLVTACTESHQLGLLQAALRRHNLWQALPFDQQQLIERTNFINELISCALFITCEELEYVCQKLGFTAVRLKGMSTAKRFYNRLQDRPCSDIDLLADADTAAVIYRLAMELGFTQGYYRRREKQIVSTTLNVTTLDRNTYELPRLSKLVDVECTSVSAADLDRIGRNHLHLDRSGLKVAVPLELHYALEVDDLIPWNPANLISEGTARFLAPQEELLYLVYKAYADMIVHRKRKGAKLFADCLRLIMSKGDQIDWTTLGSTAHCRGLCAPLRYVLHHARSTYGLGCGVPHEMTVCDCNANHRGSIDFGDIVMGFGTEFRHRTLALLPQQSSQQL